jgi:hypothetical protein
MSFTREDSVDLNDSVGLSGEEEIHYFQEIYNFLLRNELPQSIGLSPPKSLKIDATQETLNYCVSQFHYFKIS